MIVNRPLRSAGDVSQMELLPLYYRSSNSRENTVTSGGFGGDRQEISRGSGADLQQIGAARERNCVLPGR
jgi:hypothetical protein